MHRSIAIAAALLAFTVTHASAQTTQTNPASGNNGVGTAGSLDRNAGSASSTVNPATLNTQGGNSGAAGKLESDPSLGGDKKPQ